MINRRSLFIAAVTAIFPPKTMSAPWDPYAFTHTWNAWIDRLKDEKAGTVDAKSAELWEKVKEEWPPLKKQIDAMYKGNK